MHIHTNMPILVDRYGCGCGFACVHKKNAQKCMSFFHFCFSLTAFLVGSQWLWLCLHARELSSVHVLFVEVSTHACLCMARVSPSCSHPKGMPHFPSFPSSSCRKVRSSRSCDIVLTFCLSPPPVYCWCCRVALWPDPRWALNCIIWRRLQSRTA